MFALNKDKDAAGLDALQGRRRSSAQTDAAMLIWFRRYRAPMAFFLFSADFFFLSPERKKNRRLGFVPNAAVDRVVAADAANHRECDRKKNRRLG